MDTYNTVRITDFLEHCEDTEDFKSILLPKLRNQRLMWQEKIQQILTDTGLSVRQLAALCRVSEPAVRKWRNGSLPQSRDMFLRIGFAAGYGVEEMNNFSGRTPRQFSIPMTRWECRSISAPFAAWRSWSALPNPT